MDGPQAMIAVVVVAIALIGGVIAVQYASINTAERFDANESVTSGSTGTNVTLANSSIDGAYYSDDATIHNETGVLLENGTDYTWNDSVGTFEVLSEPAANETLQVEYYYRLPTDEQENATEIFGSVFNSMMWLPLVLIVALVIAAVSLFGGLS